jgi:hypothetical protein
MSWLPSGTLSEDGKAGTLWTLKLGSPTKFRGETILQVTFTTRTGQAPRLYSAYAGKLVELTGEVKEVFQGNASLSKVLTIGLGVDDWSGYLGSGGLNPNTAPSSGDSAGRVAYRHAYYLFLSDAPQGCEACYIPLLITQQSLEEIAKDGEPVLGVFIYTYERDSIWQFKGSVPVGPKEIEALPRIVRVNRRSYRYQEIFPSDVLKLLEEPLGSIPISRPYVKNVFAAGASLKELIADFRGH